MDFFPFSINVVFVPYIYVNSDFVNYKRKTDPCTIFTTFHTENALKIPEDVMKTECLARGIYYALYIGYDHNIPDSFCASTKAISDMATGHT